MHSLRTWKKPGAFAIYLTLSGGSALFMSLIFTVNVLYHTTVVQLSPLQLVLVGTILEGTVFLGEIPTGLLADLKSRRLSVIIGYALMGVGFCIEGSWPIFWGVALSQVLWGLGYTFTSGATEAWIVDELGEERAGEAFMRGSQAGQIGGLLGIPASAALAHVGLTLPILLGGVLMIGLALYLAAYMPEDGFRPTPAKDRTTWQSMAKTLGDARRMVGRQPLLGIMLGIGLFYGLYSEGVDRLWTLHVLDIGLPALGALQPVTWFALIKIVGQFISLGATELARRRVDTRHPEVMSRVLLLAAGLIVCSLVGLGLARSIWVALALLWGIGALRSITGPLYGAWFNAHIDDPQVRATMFSASSQVDSIGQVGGGSLIGAVGDLVSVRAALATSALLLAPVLPLYGAVQRRLARLVATTTPGTRGPRPGKGKAR
ncbi:MAG: MFS transporter [Chloroflexi bacterium]|nr:MFS transporter [Chloroflexota bacterium]